LLLKQAEKILQLAKRTATRMTAECGQATQYARKLRYHSYSVQCIKRGTKKTIRAVRRRYTCTIGELPPELYWYCKYINKVERTIWCNWVRKWPFTVIWMYWFWYQSKVHLRLPINDQ